MFTRRDPNEADQPAQSRNASGQTTQQAAGPDAESIIAQEDTFEGQIKTTTGVRVMGTVRGTIESQRSVRIEEGAQVEADISAEEVVIAGTYSGTLTCRNRVEITSSARVSGKIETVKLHLHEGGYFDGELRMQRTEGTARAETEEARPRRSRYVDLNAETPRATEPASGEAGEERRSRRLTCGFRRSRCAWLRLGVLSTTAWRPSSLARCSCRSDDPQPMRQDAEDGRRIAGKLAVDLKPQPSHA